MAQRDGYIVLSADSLAGEAMRELSGAWKYHPGDHADWALATQEVEEILLPGVPLGFSTNFQYQLCEFDLLPGDTILILSDGLPERLNNEDEAFGYPRTEALFKKSGDRAPKEICAHLALGGEGWAQGRLQEDDITFVVMKVKAQERVIGQER